MLKLHPSLYTVVLTVTTLAIASTGKAQTEPHGAPVPLSISVTNTVHQRNDFGVQFAVEITNNSSEVIDLTVSERSTPFFLMILDEKGHTLGRQRPVLPIIRPNKGRHLIFRAREKKIFLMSVRPRQEAGKEPIPVAPGAYQVSASLGLRQYTIGQHPFFLDMPSHVSATSTVVVTNNRAPNPPQEKNIPATQVKAIIEVAPSTLAWSIGEALQPKTVKIRITGTSVFKALSVLPDSKLFSAKLSTNKEGEEYEVVVSPVNTDAATKGYLSVKLNSRRLPLLNINLNVGQDEHSSVGAQLTPTNTVPAATTKYLGKLRLSEAAPDFDVKDANGKSWKLSALKGKKALLLTFFPKCFTGGCANHLSSLRDHQAEFDAADVQIIAVSTDPADGEKGQKAFAEQWKLMFPLIPDTSRTLTKLYGATQQNDERAARMTFLIDKRGIVRYIDTNVNVQNHGADMLAKMKELEITK